MRSVHSTVIIWNFRCNCRSVARDSQRLDEQSQRFKKIRLKIKRRKIPYIPHQIIRINNTHTSKQIKYWLKGSGRSIHRHDISYKWNKLLIMFALKVHAIKTRPCLFISMDKLLYYFYFIYVVQLNELQWESVYSCDIRYVHFPLKLDGLMHILGNLNRVCIECVCPKMKLINLIFREIVQTMQSVKRKKKTSTTFDYKINEKRKKNILAATNLRRIKRQLEKKKAQINVVIMVKLTLECGFGATNTH